MGRLIPPDTRLIAAAGTHVVSPQWGVAAVGNVYTHREYRGQGLAKVVTSAVTAELLQQCDTVVLNGASCAKLKSGQVSQVTIATGCPTEVPK